MSLTPPRFHIADDMPMSLGKAIARAIAPKVDEFKEFENKVFAPFLIKGAAQAKKARTIDDVCSDPTDAEVEYVMRLRGACTCFISPPCGRCCNPFTDAEAQEALEETSEPATSPEAETVGDGWIEWKGGVCPIPECGPKQWERNSRDGMTNMISNMAAIHSVRWLHDGSGDDIVAYRVVKP